MDNRITGAGTQFWSRASESQGNSATGYYAKCPSHLAMTLPSKNWLALAVWYHTPGTTTSRLWAGTILHWASYTWLWHIDIFVWRKHENMSVCTCTDSWVNTSYEPIASSVGTQFRWPMASEFQGDSTTCYYAKCPNYLAMTCLSS